MPVTFGSADRKYAGISSDRQTNTLGDDNPWCIYAAGLHGLHSPLGSINELRQQAERRNGDDVLGSGDVTMLTSKVDTPIASSSKRKSDGGYFDFQTQNKICCHLI